ncbi:MAG: bifunctional homocysteine S-methyltransferase/methylenetetrahydrofolate reductase [Limnochordales bacterium]|nr:bifunctional homocysteine S-methyltransferase/methylenetetrahydrofolate reductase [Limnochordales bacterium]
MECNADKGGSGQVSLAGDGGAGGLLDLLAQGVVLADGAMGTLLYSRGAMGEAGLEVLNLTQPEMVQQAHLDYVLAGARLIETNTYGANRLQLESRGLAGRVWDINLWGAKLARAAREIAGEPVLVAGAVGPLGVAGEQAREANDDALRAVYREQMEALLAGGVDLFVVETQADPREAVAAIRAARELCRLPVVVEFAFWPAGVQEGLGSHLPVSSTGEGEFVTAAGYTPEAVASYLAQLAEDERPEVIGLNCGSGVAYLLDVLERLRRALPFTAFWSAMPNAGLPRYQGGRLFYAAGPRYFAGQVARLVEADVRLIGGCCGTTPEHIQAMEAALRQVAGGGAQETARAQARRVVTAAAVPETPRPRATWEWQVAGRGAGEAQTAVREGGERASLREKLGRQFIISVELDPPRGSVAKKYLQAAAALREAGVDVINVADSPMARVRMGAVAAAFLIQHQVGVETIVHFTARDRNLMAIQSDLLGAHALGLRNVLALTGDPPSLGNLARARPVYDVDSVGLIRILHELNRGHDAAGNPIGRPTGFTIGCALSPNAEDLEQEIAHFRDKLEAGAQFVMTQPIYELAALENALEKLGGCPIPLLLGVMPLHSLKHAEYLHNEVPGISIPKRIRDELEKAGEDGLRVGFEQAAKLVAQAKASGLVAGIYVVLSFGKHEPVCDFVRKVRELVAGGSQ